MKITKSVLIIFLMGLISCAHHKDVRPGVKGVHIVRVMADSSHQGTRNATKQAQHFCEKRQLDAAFIDESNKYTGDMDEDTYITTKTASKVAQIVGGSVFAFGSRGRHRGAGGVLGLGGHVAGTIAGKGYTVTMSFKCI